MFELVTMSVRLPLQYSLLDHSHLKPCNVIGQQQGSENLLVKTY